MSSRAYTKRIWRVPKDRGAPEFLATLVCKALVKHGWPADFKISALGEITIQYKHPNGLPAGDDFFAAVEIAARVVARTYRIEIIQQWGVIALAQPYVVTPRGDFKKV